MQEPLKPLQIEELRPFPLPQRLKSLPGSVVEEFAQHHDLVSGYIKSLETYKNHRNEITTELNQQIDKLNKCTELLENYNNVSARIEQQIKELVATFNEWTNLETIQYQLLSSNFNSDQLKYKFQKLIDESDRTTEGYLKEYKKSERSEQDFNETIDKFRAERKKYHLRKEKLNRWNEERVGGFI